MNIRPATPADLDRLMEIFDAARRFMAKTGNPNQWINGYPQRGLIADEISRGHCYVCESPEKRTVGTFCFVPSPDPNYAHIEDGAWLDDKPYHVIHRIASDGSEKGIFQACINWCTSRDSNLRADTHADNKVMQHLLEQNGFIRCGIIYVAKPMARPASLTNGR